MQPNAFVSRCGGSLRGEITPPGDKSITHRGLILGAIAEGVSELAGALDADDCRATERCLAALGVEFEHAPDLVRIRGCGLRGLRAAEGPLDLGNAGTGLRLLAGVLAAQSFDSVLVGDDSLMSRPMDRIAAPLEQMGARVETTAGRPPLRLRGGRELHAIDYRLPVASAQVKSAILLAGLYAQGQTRVHEPSPTRDHTERMLSAFACEVEVRGELRAVRGPACPRATRVEVPGDFSSAAFFIVAACLCPGSDVVLRGVGINPTRTGLLDVLRDMGGRIELSGQRMAGEEPVADIRVRASRLQGVAVPPELVPRVIDELPVLFVAAACAEGETTVCGAGELRLKESDRLATMTQGLRALGVRVSERADGLQVCGGDLSGGEVQAHGDHRVAMAFAVAGQQATAPVRVLGVEQVATSFPGFLETAQGIGFALEAG